MGNSLRAALALATGLAFTVLPVSALPPSGNYVLHESRAPIATGGSGHRHWKHGRRLDSNAVVPLRIGLKQSNLHLGYEKLMDVAHPSSENFGKHLTEIEVHDLFAPSEDTFNAVYSWLVDIGINKADIHQYTNKGWLAVNLPVSRIEDMFVAQYYEHERDSVVRIGTDQYSVPQHLAEHIDYILPGVKLSPPMVKRTMDKRDGSKTGKWLGSKMAPPQLVQQQKAKHNSSIPLNLQYCATNFTTDCSRALYKIPTENVAVPGHEPAIYKTGPSYSQNDLDDYYHTFAPYVANGTHPKVLSIDGGALAPGDLPDTGGSNIEIEIIQSLIWPQTMVIYQVDDRLYENENSSMVFNTFLDALDGSYCHSTAFNITGDSPGIDPSYPDTRPGGYNKPEMCGTYKPANVISISYGEGELDVPKNYFLRQCNEWLKLGLQGTTVLVTSGDYGAASFPGDISATGCLSGSGQNQTIYNPISPASCPYLTAVGGTQMEPGTSVLDAEVALQTAIAPTPFFTLASGGGFSNYFPVPDYQKSTVDNYFAKHDPGHPYYVANEDASNIGENGGIYNRNGRGIPDVSAHGAEFHTFVNGTSLYYVGTFLSTQIWASVITLINQERAHIGKGPVGFINPTLYANPKTLTDIKQGSGPSCGTSGFTAVEGWDPITGLGTPNYPALLAMWLSLP